MDASQPGPAPAYEYIRTEVDLGDRSNCGCLPLYSNAVPPSPARGWSRPSVTTARDAAKWRDEHGTGIQAGAFSESATIRAGSFGTFNS